jgi:hypothetical protein
LYGQNYETGRLFMEKFYKKKLLFIVFDVLLCQVASFNPMYLFGISHLFCALKFSLILVVKSGLIWN